MYDRDTVLAVMELRAAGLGARRIARRLDLPLSTVRDWTAGKVPRKNNPDRCATCGAPAHDVGALSEWYPYLLGLYLGDGCISAHPRGVFKMRIVLDVAYPGIIAEAQMAIAEVIAGPANFFVRPNNCVDVYGYSKAWPCLFPQHGPGKKHERAIDLARWQIALVKLSPEKFLRGLIHSDGCRFENTGRNGWRAPRYSFSNLSEDILALFCWACELLDLHWTEAPNTVYVSRKADVARMDEFIGPKT